jgi:signal transduction histidine kinase
MTSGTRSPSPRGTSRWPTRPSRRTRSTGSPKPSNGWTPSSTTSRTSRPSNTTPSSPNRSRRRQSRGTRGRWSRPRTPNPCITADRPVDAHASRLKRLFENLFSNAVTHTETPVTVEVGDLESGFYVADTGSGIWADDGDRLFEPRVTTGDGTGLGLAIVAEIADVHDWSYAVTEHESGGARFEFTVVPRP